MKKIEEIMGCYQPPAQPLAAEEQARIYSRALELAGLADGNSGREAFAEPAPVVEAGPDRGPRAAGRRSRRRLPMLIAACVAIFAFATAFAATDLDQALADLFRPADDAQLATLNELAVPLSAEATAGGLTIRARQAVGDANNVYIAFDLIAPPDMALSENQYDFLSAFVDVSSGRSMGYRFDYSEDDDPTDNQKTFLLDLNVATGTAGERIELTFKDFCRYKTEEELSARPAAQAGQTSWGGTAGDENDDRVVLIPGEWKLAFDLDYKDASRRCRLDQEVQAGGRTLKARELRISPISVTVTLKSELFDFQGDGPADGDSGQSDLVVTLRRGGVVESSGMSTSTGTTLTGLKTVITLPFAGVVDPTEIESITLNGVELKYK